MNKNKKKEYKHLNKYNPDIHFLQKFRQNQHN